MKRFIEIGLNIIFWTICGYLIFSIFGSKNMEIEIIDNVEIINVIYDQRLIYSNLLGFVIKMSLYYFNVYFLSRYFNQKHFQAYGLYLLIATTIAFGLDFIKSALVFGIEFYTFDSFIASLSLYIFFVGISFVHIIILRWQKEEALKQQLKEDKLAAELELLKSQINPHFLFNALNNLLSVSEKHQQTEVSSGIAQLSEMLRYLLHNTSDEIIPLSKEIEFIENYIKLNKLRFDDNDPIKISFQTIGNSKNIYIAPVLLLPFVENAFKHGINIYNDSFIDIKINATQQIVNFECTNSINRSKNIEMLNSKYSGVGLQNVKRRLEILYPNKYNLKITEKDNIYSVHLKLNINA